MQNKISRWLDNKVHLALTILIPSMVLLLAFAYIPAMYSLRFSFMKYNIKMPLNIHFNGIENYIYIIKDPTFQKAVFRVIYFMIVSTFAVLGIGMLFAQVLSQDFKMRGFLRAAIIIPWAIPPVVNGHLWKWIFNGEYGAFNGLLYQLGIIKEYQFWLTNPTVALNIAIFIFVWRYVPFITILFLGVLQSIPLQLYEAAKVDGAGAVRRFFSITLGSMRRISVIAVVLTLIASFSVFDGIYALMEFDEATKTPMIYNYQMTFEMGRFGRGSAMAYLVGLFLFSLAFLYIRMSLKDDEQ